MQSAWLGLLFPGSWGLGLRDCRYSSRLTAVAHCAQQHARSTSCLPQCVEGGLTKLVLLAVFPSFFLFLSPTKRSIIATVQDSAPYQQSAAHNTTNHKPSATCRSSNSSPLALSQPSPPHALAAETPPVCTLSTPFPSSIGVDSVLTQTQHFKASSSGVGYPQSP